MNKAFEDVLAFHVKLAPDRIGTRPAVPPDGRRALVCELMAEELAETRDAMEAGDLPGVADGLADLIYVAIGAAISWGIDLRPVWAEVQRANMAKEGGSTREDGKVLKPPGWVAPDVAGVLDRQGSLLGMTNGEETR